MAPIGEAYFPPLDRCFSGKHQLWSWESCYIALSQHEKVPKDGSLKKFLSDPQTIELLLYPIAPYPQPSGHSKSSFETKTSAINVTSASHARYDISEIKEESVWLSERTKIDEVSALRLAVLEWQTRPAKTLLQGKFSGILAGGLKASVDPVDSEDFRISRTGTAESRLGLDQTEQTLSSKQLRRQRLIQLLLSERRYVLKCSGYLLSYVVYTLEDSENGQQNRDEALRVPWLREIGLDLLSKWAPEKPANSKQVGRNPNFIGDAISEVRSKLGGLESGSGWSLPEAGQDFEVIWGCNQAMEMIHILQIIQTLLQSTVQVLQAAVTVPWFRLMGECGFFEGFELPYPGLETAYNQPLQGLAALISLTLLNVPGVLDLLNQASTASLSAYSSSGSTPYILDQPAANEMNDILIYTSAIPVASPTILAWSIVTQNLREIALATKDSREMRQSIRAADKFSGGDSSDTDGSERPVTRSLSAIRRRSSTSSDTSQQSTLLEEIYDSICITAVDDDPIMYLAKTAVEGGKVFGVLIAIATQYCRPYAFEHHGAISRKLRLSLLHLIQASAEYVEYQPDLINATMATVTGSERYWDMLDEPTLSMSNGLAILLRQDEIMKRRILLVALSRFPYEAVPLLQLCTALAHEDSSRGSVFEVPLSLQKLDIFTCALPLDYQGYTNIREDEESDFVELTEDYIIDLKAVFKSLPSQPKDISALSSGSRLLSSASTQVQIPRGTQGQVLSNKKPLVVAWNHNYSGLAYIGKVLGSASSSNTSNEPSMTAISNDFIGEAIGFIATILISIYKGKAGELDPLAMRESASSILHQASDELDEEEDIVSVIWRIFEIELYKPGNMTGGGTLDLLVECVQFTHALLLVMPDRVWPFLGRNGLFRAGENGGRLGLLVSTYEMVTGHYSFLLGCIRLYDALIEDVVEHAVSRNIPAKAVTRFDDVSHSGTGVSKSTMEKVLLSIQYSMIDVFNSLRSWRFVDENDRAEIAAWLCDIFGKLQIYCFGTNLDLDCKSHLTSTLLPAASVILDVYLSNSSTDLVIDPLLQMCSEGLAVSCTSLPSRGQRNGIRRTTKSLRLISTLLAASDSLGRDSSYLQKHLFNNAGVFVRLYAMHEAFKLPVINLLSALVCSSSLANQEPPSLLGHLGQEIASNFLEILSVLDQPISNENLAIAIWSFLAAIVSSPQQWFAHFVLTGSTPRDTIKSKEDAQNAKGNRSESIFDVALDSLCLVESLEPRKALEMLRFVALAADFWPQMFPTLDKHPRFLLSISEFASRQSSISAFRSLQTSEDAIRIKMASHAADILALYAHWTQQEGKPRFNQELLKHLPHLAKNAIMVPSYNASLHSNLRQNFSAKFPGYHLNDFQRSTLKSSSLGEAYFYDLDLAKKVLQFDPSWEGRRGQGFADEIRRANLNLSSVEAQVALFHSWKALLIELVGPLAAEAKFQKIMAQTAIDCLRANAENNLPEAFFERLARSRIDLAFALLESLNRTKSTETEVKDILPAAWKTLRNHNIDVGAALIAEDSDYHRMLIRILYLALQVHNSVDILSPTKSWSMTKDSPTMLALEIISVTVAQGFRSLTKLLHDLPHLVSPSDFSMLIALFRSCLRVPNVVRNSEHLINAFSNSQTTRCTSTLLSWSDQLAASSYGDPIYGEVSILFLLELSTVPALAENLAVEGVLSYILTTNLAQLLQNRSFGPFTNPPRMYAIWSRGILPLLLNLLHAVGPPVAAEVAAALNTFPQQLTRATQAFGVSASTTNKPDHVFGDAITLSMAQEASCLALIVKILRTFHEAGASAAVVSSQIEEVRWDATQVKDDIEGWLQRRGALRDRIVPSNDREEAWAKAKPDKEGAGESKLEEKVLVELMCVVDILENSGG